MARYVALLRGINLGARNRVPMARLREIVEQQGARNVRTYIASGNVICDSTESATRLRSKLECAIEAEFGFNIIVAVVTPTELRKVVEGNPYQNAQPGTLHVAFTTTPLTAEERLAVAKFNSPPEELSAAKSHVYLHLPKGFGAGQANREVDKLIGKRATIRNWRTVETLARMAAQK